MKKNTTWEILGKLTKNQTFGDLIQLLLKNRGITEKDEFLHPDLSLVTAKTVGIDEKQLEKAVERIKKAKKEKEQVIVYGDYDVDGITGTAILWEALNGFGVIVHPFIPSRADEGYGLSIKGIEHILSEYPATKIIITVDNGIVANEAVDFANKKGIDVIITDHHVMSDVKPNAYAIVHTTKLCGAGVGWLMSKEFQHDIQDHLALVALATVADLVPLVDTNRIVLTEGLKILHTTKRPGIVALCEEAGIDQSGIGVYEIGHMIAPRLNAMGRISSAMDSLRLLCTKDVMRAKALAEKHDLTNKDRQELTQTLSDHAKDAALQQKDNILFIAHETYDEGVIGLVAGKLVETYYRPSIVIAKKKDVSKASARSIAGFNIIAFIRSGQHLLINAGGHPMAAGFTIATEKIAEFEKFVKDNAEKFDTSLLSKKLFIDCEIPLEMISQKFYDSLQILQPFGMNNPEPTFFSNARVVSVKQIGKEKQHLSFTFQSPDGKGNVAGIGFGLGERFKEFPVGNDVNLVYTISENKWNGKKSLQLKIRDIKRSEKTS